MAELFVNADETGMHSTARWVMVFGYIADPQTWDAFGKDWHSIVLDPEYAVKDGVFHAIDFFQGRGQYRKWPAEKRNQFLLRLVETIRRYDLYPVGRGIDRQAFMSQPFWFRKYLTGARLKKTGALVYSGAPNDPYHLALTELMVDALQKAGEEDVVHFIMGQQDEMEGYATGHFNRIRTLMVAEGDSRASQLGRIAYSTGGIDRGLQAADLWNYLCQLKLGRGLLNGREQWALEMLAEHVDRIKLWGEDSFAAAYEPVVKGLWRGALAKLEKEGL